MNCNSADGLPRRLLAYRGAKGFSFGANISTMLMFCASFSSGDSRGTRATDKPRPWFQGYDSSNRDPGLRARSEAIWRVDLRPQQMAAAERRHVGQLAHDQEVLGAHRLLGECDSHENPRRCLARGTGMEEGARRAGVDQC